MIDLRALWAALETTWPAQNLVRIGPFIWREADDLSGGYRVCAATFGQGTTVDDLSLSGIEMIEAHFRSEGRPALFRLHQGDEVFDAMLGERGYECVDPTLCFVADVTTFPPPPVDTGYAVWPPIAVQRDIWTAGGIGRSRLAIMERSTCQKTSFLGRADDLPAGACFAAVDGEIAMVHALEISPAGRRKSVARHLMAHAAHWAKENGAAHLAALTVRDNAPAQALYSSLGMRVAGQYHYRKKIGI